MASNVLSSSGGGGTVLRGFIDGLIISNNGTSSITVQPGMAADSTTTAFITLASATTKTTSAWASGTGNGGLDTGTIAANTWYHVFGISQAAGANPDVLFSLSATAPTMPSTYPLFRRIGSQRTDGSSHWMPMVQKGDMFKWKTFANDISTGIAQTTLTLFTFTTPSGIKTQPILLPYQPSGNSALDIRSPDEASVGASFSDLMFYVANGMAISPNFWTNTSSQLLMCVNLASNIIIKTIGWIDSRNKDN